MDNTLQASQPPPPVAPPAPTDQTQPLPQLPVASVRFARAFSYLLKLLIAILAPFHAFVGRHHLECLLTTVITLAMLGSGSILITSSHALWLPLVPTVGSLLISLVSRQHWLQGGLPLAVLAYILGAMDLGIVTMNLPTGHPSATGPSRP